MRSKGCVRGWVRVKSEGGFLPGREVCYTHKVTSLRKWRNWQTHKLEVLALKGVGVQVPPSAPKSLSSWG